MKSMMKKLKRLGASLYVTLFALCAVPCCAFAADTDNALKSNSTLKQVFSLLETGVTIAGTGLIVWGAVNIGMAVSQHQGDNMTPGILKIVGGAIMVAAAIMFGQVLS